MEKIFLLILLIFLLSAFPAGSDAASRYEKMKKGKELFEQEKFDESLNTFVDAQIEFPEDPDLKYNIASTHYKMKNYEEAVKGYLDVAVTAQDAALEEKALYNIGNAKYRQGKLEEAVEYYKKALELDPEDKDVQHNLEFVREEIKRRVNESKKTEKQQQQQQQKDQQQKAGDQGQQNQEQSGKDDQDKQSKEDGQKQEQEAGKEEQDQGGSGKKEKEEKDEQQQQDGNGSSMHAREMTEEEAEQWLNSIQENRDKFKKKKQMRKRSVPYRPDKDW